MVSANLYFLGVHSSILEWYEQYHADLLNKQPPVFIPQHDDLFYQWYGDATWLMNRVKSCGYIAAIDLGDDESRFAHMSTFVSGTINGDILGISKHLANPGFVNPLFKFMRALQESDSADRCRLKFNQYISWDVYTFLGLWGLPSMIHKENVPRFSLALSPYNLQYMMGKLRQKK